MKLTHPQPSANYKCYINSQLNHVIKMFSETSTGLPNSIHVRLVARKMIWLLHFGVYFTFRFKKRHKLWSSPLIHYNRHFNSHFQILITNCGLPYCLTLQHNASTNEHPACTTVTSVYHMTVPSPPCYRPQYSQYETDMTTLLLHNFRA